MSDNYQHVSVMPVEVMQYLDCRPGDVVVDCTLGGCGHSRLILEKIMPGGLLIGIDQDKDSLDNAGRVLGEYMSGVKLFHGNFAGLADYLSESGIEKVDAILADIGISFHHIQGSGRGFSFTRNEPLDMRMDTRNDLTAHDVVNGFEEKELARIFKEYGEENFASRIAREIVRKRQVSEIGTSLELADIVSGCIPRKFADKSRIHPATRVFMAIRIAVNRELEVLERFMDSVPDHLKTGGRLCVLSFHSLEDRIVKHRIRGFEKPCTCPQSLPRCVCGRLPLMKSLTRKAVTPSEAEIMANPMSRSTRLRAAIRL